MIHFFVGTVAELIKLFPVMSELSRAHTPYRVIASGQNSLQQPDLWRLADHAGPDVVLSTGPAEASAQGLGVWWLKMLTQARNAGIGKGDWVVVHGDTVSTLMGALFARANGAHLAHVEAGLRSYNWLEPFPEEISRVACSQFVDIAFCPSVVAEQNLRRQFFVARRPEIVLTQANTLIDSLSRARDVPLSFLADDEQKLHAALPRDYGVFVLHRQENLLATARLRTMFELVLEAAPRRMFVLWHHNTEVAIKNKAPDLWDRLQAATHLIHARRQSYLSFTKLLLGAQFLVTDGGSNQEEAAYMGLPCALLRRHTERQEGLGENVLLTGSEPAVVRDFLQNSERYRRPPLVLEASPSHLIATRLTQAHGHQSA